jgi:hypothetical protein
MKTSAILSPCKRYRYQLRRTWDEFKPAVLFIGLNPSTADATFDDNTSRVCIAYATRWNYGTLLLGNLFAFRSRNPAALRVVADAVGPDNDAHLISLQAEAAMVICAWGDGGGLFDRDIAVLKLLRNPYCFGKLKSGRPGHPLYKRKDLRPTRL